jgi:Ca-activated chloride channel family protein
MMMTSEDRMKTKRKTAVDPGYLLLMMYLTGVIILTVLSWCKDAGAAIPAQTITLEEVQRGELLLPGKKPGQYLAAPMLSMEVDIKVSGIVARTTVKQHFKNDSRKWTEALYVFPLPDESAVDHMQMHIGERIIVGEIQEKKEARKTYEAAKKAGKKASLLSQQRPNIFTTSVANIAPGETVTILIEYQQLIKRQDNIFSLRFPMVIGPRYQPGAGFLPDLPTIAEDKPVNPIRLHVDLAPGMDLARVDSLYHGISSKKTTDNSFDIHFSGEVKADRDFVLEWEPVKNEEPVVTIFKEQKEDETYMLLMVMPPRQQQKEPLARETVFILDTSGSMGGPSIRQAKKALLTAVARMRPEDRFNVIEFNSETRTLFSASSPGTPANVQKAASFINQLEARGGTEIKPALELALDGRKDHERIRQVVFLTDACVSNEEELLTVIHRQLGDSRLFTVGIGSAPNSYFMTRAAAMGKGSYTFIGKIEEVEKKMTALFGMLEQPAVTDLQLSGLTTADILPSPLPDLYQGEPLVAVLKSTETMENFQLSGLLAGKTPWQVKVDTSKLTSRPGIGVLWARKKIRMLMDSLAAGTDPQIIRNEVLQLALNNHLVSRYTSLVAVEQKISRPGSIPLEKHRQKTNLPAGWQYDSIFAGSAATATPAALFFLTGMALFVMAGILMCLRRKEL